MSIHENREKPHELRLDMPAAHSAERLARAVMRQFVQREGVPSEELDALGFVASELLSNAVDHGGGHSAMEESDAPPNVRVQFLLRVRPDGWEMRVSDQGGGDPTRVQALIEDPDLPGPEDERGRGFFLLKSMLEGLTVERSEDGLGLVFIAQKVYAGG
ncbi:MAG: ATP-binding protein [Planctomycetes bacterium]|nr:ATP-binding protein [Planctomycetota bacterium]